MTLSDVERGLGPVLLAGEERRSRHLLRNRNAEHLERGRSDGGELGERSETHASGIIRDIEAIHEVERVRSLGKPGLVILHLLGVAMVGVDEHVRVELEKTRQDLADALVSHLDGLRRRLLVAGVPDHVAVRVVDDDHAVGVLLDRVTRLAD